MNRQHDSIAPVWTRLTESLSSDLPIRRLEVEGTIPDWLRGALYRNGPARFEVGGTRLGHLFDGDGAITLFRFDDGGVEGGTRFVHTPEMDHEQATGRSRYGGFTTPSRHPFLDFLTSTFRNAANTSVLPWQGRLLALWEGGLPTEVDPVHLDTIGRTDLGGVIPGGFSAHPHYVPARRAWYNIGLKIGRTNQITLFELPDRGSPRRVTQLQVDAGMLHDFAVTERHAILFLSPLRLQWWKVPFGTPYADALTWREEEGTEIVVIPLDEPARLRRFRAEAFYQWHFANAFCDGDDIVVDLVRYPDWKTDQWLRQVYAGAIEEPSEGRYARARIAGDTLTTETVWERSVEFPVIDGRYEGRAHRVTWMSAHAAGDEAHRSPLNRIARLDCETGDVIEADLGADTYPAEPVFVPRPGGDEGDGVLLPLTYDGRSDRSFLPILDASTLEEHGRVWLSHVVPQTFHGRFVGE